MSYASSADSLQRAKLFQWNTEMCLLPTFVTLNLVFGPNAELLRLQHSVTGIALMGQGSVGARRNLARLSKYSMKHSTH